MTQPNSSPAPSTPRVDAHFHSWQLARGDYGWLTPQCGVIHRDVTIDDWAREAGRHGIHAGVLVQAAPTEAETHWLLGRSAEDSRVLGVVGWADLLAPDAVARVEALARHPRLKGLRPMLQDLPDPRWIEQPALAPALHALAETGLVFDALVRSEHLPSILRLAQRHPRLRIVIDHGAKPAIGRRQWQPWADDLARIARDTSAVCKLSGLLTECGGPPAPGQVAPWADHLLEHFGPDRVLWGSDWPVLELAAPYERWWAQTQQLLAPLDNAQRQAVLGGNAVRVYGLSAPAVPGFT